MERCWDIIMKCGKVAENMSDDILTAKVLNSLLNSFDSFITAFECSENTSCKTLRMKLTSEVEIRRMKVIDRNSEPSTSKDNIAHRVVMPTGHTIEVADFGTVVLLAGRATLTLGNVLYVPDLKGKAKFVVDNTPSSATSSCKLPFAKSVCNLPIANLTLYEWHVKLDHQNLPHVKETLFGNNIDFKDE
ncbi:hypothetical protein PR048_023599 [Dryococelus australis]|uniref:GAG-pre-integrase domain-containing protein n=1 Tax=Dryococelus australis TaxID=614101 RepID=A0ABQ9GUK2_9NEOP|nr:hypothetical protein PR048_023599 [Dryococelus australis]